MSYPVGPPPIGYHYGTYAHYYRAPTQMDIWRSCQRSWRPIGDLYIDCWEVRISDANNEAMGFGRSKYLWLAKCRARKDARFWKLDTPYERWGLIKNERV